MAVTSLRSATWNSEEWRELGSCRKLDTGLFFPIGQTGEAEVKIARAKKVCGACPVRQQCLEFAITTNQEYGVWGATARRSAGSFAGSGGPANERR